MDEYPTSSENIAPWTPAPPADQVAAEKEEQIKLASSIGVVQDVLDWFSANANMYASIDSLGIDENSSSEDAKLAILLSKKLKLAFESKADVFRAEFERYLEKK